MVPAKTTSPPSNREHRLLEPNKDLRTTNQYTQGPFDPGQGSVSSILVGRDCRREYVKEPGADLVCGPLPDRGPATFEIRKADESTSRMVHRCSICHQQFSYFPFARPVMRQRHCTSIYVIQQMLLERRHLQPALERAFRDRRDHPIDLKKSFNQRPA
jgi:hypothetical protein